MFKKLLALAVAAGIIAGGVYLFRIRHQLFRPDVDRVGGTELVFDLLAPAEEDDLDAACEVLRKRFDDDGRAGLRVSREGDKRLVLVVPNGRTHDEIVIAAGRLAQRRGRLEFRALATEYTDRPAVDQAKAWFLDTKNPLPVKPQDMAGGLELSVGVGAVKERYRWFRMSESCARVHLGRSPVPTGVATREVIAAAYNFPIHVSSAPGGASSEHFAVCREPNAGETIAGEQVTRVRVAFRDARMLGGIEVTFDSAGTRRLLALAPNRSAAPGRHGAELTLLAGILDGEIVFFYSMYTALPRKIVFHVYATSSEIEELSMLMRGGELPVQLAPKPTERTLAPQR